MPLQLDIARLCMHMYLSVGFVWRSLYKRARRHEFACVGMSSQVTWQHMQLKPCTCTINSMLSKSFVRKFLWHTFGILHQTYAEATRSSHLPTTKLFDVCQPHD